MMNKPTLVYSQVYNEELHVGEVIESVLNQTYEDFLFLISDNFSSDKTRSIIDSYTDTRIKIVMPPTHLPSINHYQWLSNYISSNYSNIENSIFIGGHDTWSENYLEVLTEKMAHCKHASIIYTDTFEIDAHGQKIRTFPNNINTVGVKKALRPISIIASLTHNVIHGGLWKESVRRKVTHNIPHCAGQDHLTIAHASLFGDIIYAPGAFTSLRAVEGASNWDYYYRKHLKLTRSDKEAGLVDFAKQLSYALDIQKEAVSEDTFNSQKPILDSLCISLVLIYLSRNQPHLGFFNDLPQLFFENKHILKILQNQVISYQQISKFTEEILRPGFQKP